jgi:hypothetical protein
LSYPITEYTNGLLIGFVAHQSNASTSAQSAIGSLTSKSITRSDGTGLFIGDIQSGSTYLLLYSESSANLLLLNPGKTYATWTPTFSGSGSLTFTSTTIHLARFRIDGGYVEFELAASGTTGGVANIGITFTLPVNANATEYQYETFAAAVADGGNRIGATGYLSAASGCTVQRFDAANYGLGAARYIYCSGRYRRA